MRVTARITMTLDLNEPFELEEFVKDSGFDLEYDDDGDLVLDKDIIHDCVAQELECDGFHNIFVDMVEDIKPFHVEIVMEG
jgi:hypothetical protein